MLSLLSLSLALSLVTFTNAQFLSSLPSCIQNCINNSQDTSCSSWDIACFCRSSSGSFLPDLLLCIHNSCDDTPDTNLFLLPPFKLACDIAGAPIPASAISSAEAAASSIAAGTVTVTSYPTATALSSILSTVTMTTTKAGTTLVEVYPMTIGSATTVTGKGSTMAVPASQSSSSTSAGVVTSTSMVVVVPTASSSITTKTSTAPNSVDTNSSPFQNQPSAASSQAVAGRGLVLSLLLIIGYSLY